MPDQDNVSMEKVSLSSSDFADDLGSNPFGIQDTQVLATKDLQRFLLSEPDEIKEVGDEEEVEDTVEDKKQVPTQKKKEKEDTEDKTKTPPKENANEQADKTKALEALLYGEDVEESEDKDKSKNTQTQESEDDIYNTLSKDLMRLGVFTSNSEDETEENIAIKTPEEFQERFNLEKKKGAINILENFLNQFGPEYKEMFDAVFVNSVKPQDYLHSLSKIEAISGLDISDEGNQERIVRAYYKGLKWDETKIETRIQKLKDYGDLEDEAKSYQELLVNKEKETIAETEKKKIEEAAKEKEKEVTKKKSFHRILAEKLKAQEIDGIPLNQKEAEATLEYLTEKKYKLQSGELLSEFDKDILELNRPENHELKVKLGLLLRKKLDLSSVKKTTISKKSEAIFSLTAKNAKSNPNKEKEHTKFF